MKNNKLYIIIKILFLFYFVIIYKYYIKFILSDEHKK